MRWLRAFLRRRPFQRPSDPQQQQRPNPSKDTLRKSSGMAAAALYACTMSGPATLGAAPEDVEGKKHHLKDGKGFTNPWESWKEMGAFEILGTMVG